MAENKKPAKAVTAEENAQLATKKRRLRTQPTLREKTERAGKKPGKTANVKHVASKPLRAFGRGVAKVWATKWLAPLRWLGRIIAPRYIRNSFAELRQVSWPKPALVWRLTGAVLAFGLIMGLAIAGLDWSFEKLFREVLLG